MEAQAMCPTLEPQLAMLSMALAFCCHDNNVAPLDEKVTTPATSNTICCHLRL